MRTCVIICTHVSIIWLVKSHILDLSKRTQTNYFFISSHFIEYLYIIATYSLLEDELPIIWIGLLVNNWYLQWPIEYLDPLQFAYKSGRGTEDATLTLLNTVVNHLQLPKTHVRILFTDFSSVFNTLQTYILLRWLFNLNVNRYIITWIRDLFSL